MRKTPFFFVLLCASFLILSFWGCKKKEKAIPIQGKEEPSSGELHVAFASPRGETASLHESDSVVVIFDRAMIPLEALPEGSAPALIEFSPSFPGKFRWLNPRTLAFTPDKRFPFSTSIEASVPAGTRSFDGYALKEDYSWTFQTVTPRLVNHFPVSNQKWLKSDTKVLLVFNQPVTKEKASDFLSWMRLLPGGGEAELQFSLRNPSQKLLEENRIKAPAEEVLLLESKEELALDSAFKVVLRRGLPGKEGPLGMDEEYSFQFETVGPFRFEGFPAGEEHNPYEALKLRFSNPVVYKEFVKKIRFESEVSIPDYYLEWDHSDSTLWISLPFEPETVYTLRIDPDLEDEFGNRLQKEVKLEFRTAPYPASFSMNTGHGILEAYSQLRFPFYVVNCSRIGFQAAPVKTEEIIPLLTQEKFFWSSEKFEKKGFFRTDEVLELDISHNKKEMVPLDLKKHFPEKYGVIFLQFNTFLKDKWNRYPKAFLQITELGLSAKFSPESTLVWVTALRTGNPVRGTEVEIKDDRDKVLWKGISDEKGIIQAPGWKELGVESPDKWNRPRVWIFARKGEDSAFLSSEWETGIFPYRFGIPYDWNPQPVEIQGAVFTDRGIYRAGETVHIKGILRKREKGEWVHVSGRTVECEVLDPFQKSVFKEKRDLDSYSSFSFDLETAEEASLGTYGVKATLPPETKGGQAATVYSSFRVEAFRPAEFELHLRSLGESFIFRDNYEAEVRASYLFGGAMASQKVRWHLRLNPTHFSPPGHKGYVFGNLVEWWDDSGREDSRLVSSGESVLGDEGKIQVSAKLLPEKENDSVEASLEATVEGPSRRSVSSRIQTLVHRGEYYIGLQPETTFLAKGKEMAINVITVQPDGALDPGKKIELKVFKREWHSVRKAEIGGRFRWVSERKDTEVESWKFKTKGTAYRVLFRPEKSGFYLLKAEGKDRKGNVVTTSAYFYVTGKDYVPWERKDEDVVELVAENADCKPGDVARILVKSPYEKADALITVEREFVLETRVVELSGSAEFIEIPIRPEHIPNIFVSVLLVQGRTAPQADKESEDLGKPSFKIGYASLNVNPAEKRLDVDIQHAKPIYKPGEEVELQLHVKDWKEKPLQSSLSLAVVDVGVLNLIGFKTPDPFSVFYSRKALAVHTSDSRPYVIRQLLFGEKGEDVGGGVGEEMKAFAPLSLSEVELRGIFKFTAYWNPSIETDEEGRASVRFTLPDNVTTFRVMAVAQSRDSRFGRADTTFRVTKPLLLRAALPRFARVGDEFQGGLSVHNNTPEKGDIVLECRAEGIALLEEETSRRFSLEPGEGKEVLFSFRAEKPGTASFEFRAQMGKESDGLKVGLPLHLPRPEETVALFSSTSESAEEEIRIPGDVYSPKSRLEFRASASALSGLEGSVEFLRQYPYLCLEQRLSAVLPFLAAEDVILDFKLSEFSRRKLREHVRKSLKDIFEFQKESGGFGLWPESRHDSPFLSCYAAFVMALAQKGGYALDTEGMDRLLQYLQNVLRIRFQAQAHPYSEKTWKTVHAFALYALSLFNRPDAGYAEKLFSERASLSLFGKTLLLKALFHGNGSLKEQDTLIQELSNTVKMAPTAVYFEDDEGRGGGWIYGSSLRTTAFILQSMLEVGAEKPFLPSVVRWIIEKRKSGHWSTTQENFWVFYALNEFYKKYESVSPRFRIEVSLAGKKVFEEMFRERTHTGKAVFPLGDFRGDEQLPLKIKMKGEGTLYYQMRMTYAPARPLFARDEGFSVYKKITALDGKPLDTIKAGSLVVVSLQVILPKEGLFVVVEDPLPAGLEAVNPVFLTESAEDMRRLEELSRGEEKHWWEGFNHIELHDDRVLLFADSLSPGIHTHRYLARALSFGTFHTPGTKVEEMYASEVFGRGAEATVKIVR